MFKNHDFCQIKDILPRIKSAKSDGLCLCFSPTGVDKLTRYKYQKKILENFAKILKKR